MALYLEKLTKPDHKQDWETINSRLRELLTTHQLTDVLEYLDEEKIPLEAEEIKETVADKLVDKLRVGYLESAIKLQEVFKLSDDVLTSENVAEAAAYGLAYRSEKVRSGDLQLAGEIVYIFKLPKKVIRSEKIQEAIKEGIQEWLSYGHERHGFPLSQENAKWIEKKFHLKDIRAEIILAIDREITHGDWAKVTDLQKIFEIPQVEIQSKMKKALQARIAEGLDVPKGYEDIIGGAATAVFIEKISVGNAKDAFEIENAFGLRVEARSPKMFEAAREGFEAALKGGYIIDAQRILSEFGLDDKFTRPMVKDAFTDHLRTGNHEIAREIAKIFDLPEKVARAAVREVLLDKIKNREIANAIRIDKIYDIDDSSIRAEAKNGFLEKCAEVDSPEGIVEIRDFQRAFEISDEEIQVAVSSAYMTRLREGNLMVAAKLVEKFRVPEKLVFSPEATACLVAHLGEMLSEYYYDVEIAEIRHAFQVSDMTFTAAVKKGVIVSLEKKNYSHALELRRKYRLPPVDDQEIGRQMLKTVLTNN